MVSVFMHDIISTHKSDHNFNFDISHYLEFIWWFLEGLLNTSSCCGNVHYDTYHTLQFILMQINARCLLLARPMS